MKAATALRLTVSDLDYAGENDYLEQLVRSLVGVGSEYSHKDGYRKHEATKADFADFEKYQLHLYETYGTWYYIKYKCKSI